MPRWRTLTLVAAVLGSAAVMSGCSSSPAASPSGNTVAPSSSATTKPTAGQAPSSSSPSCPTAKAVGAAMDASYAAPQVTSGAAGTMCVYNPGNGGNDVTLTMSSGITSGAIESLAKQQGSVSSMTQLSGLGQVAYLDVGTPGISSELFVLQGSNGIEVTAFGTKAEMEAVARAAIAG